MRIVQIGNGMVRIPPNKGGGSESTILSWSRGLAELGNNVVILDGKYSDSDQNEHVDDVTIFRLKTKSLRPFPLEKVPGIAGFFKKIRMNLNLLTFAFSSLRYVRVNEVDIIQTHYLAHAIIFLIFCPSSRKKLFFAVHSTFWSNLPWNISSWWGGIRETTVMKHTVGVRVQNRIELERSLALGVSPGKLLLLGPPIDTGLWAPNSIKVQRKEFHFSEEKNILLFVGRIVEDKGVEYLIDALNLIVNEYGLKNILLFLVGPIGGFHEKTDEYYSKIILPSIKKHNLTEYVEITGALSNEDLLKLYAICDIFVLPSIREGTPLVSVQAMCFAKPVIASNVGGLPEQIIDGNNGLIFEPRNSRQLAQKIKLLLDNVDLRLRMGQNGRQIAVNKYDYRIAAKKLLQLYETTINYDSSH